MWEGWSREAPPYPDWCLEHVRQLEAGSPLDNLMIPIKCSGNAMRRFYSS